MKLKQSLIGTALAAGETRRRVLTKLHRSYEAAPAHAVQCHLCLRNDVLPMSPE
jgi:hypothetical protein